MSPVVRRNGSIFAEKNLPCKNIEVLVLSLVTVRLINTDFFAFTTLYLNAFDLEI